MVTFGRALVLVALLGAVPALAQEPSQPPAARAVTATGQTKPPAGSAGAAAPSSLSVPPPKPLSEADMIKAQKAAEDRSKAWDSKMRRTMGSICKGC